MIARLSKQTDYSDSLVDEADQEIDATASVDALAIESDRASDADTEDCPVIYADRVYLGLVGLHRLRVVCWSGDDRRASSPNAA